MKHKTVAKYKLRCTKKLNVNKVLTGADRGDHHVYNSHKFALRKAPR